MFGAAAAPSAAPLFGAAAPAAAAPAPLFGAPAPPAAASATTPLFGAPAAQAPAATAPGASLFGAPAGAPAAGGLFGAPAAHAGACPRGCPRVRPLALRSCPPPPEGVSGTAVEVHARGEGILAAAQSAQGFRGLPLFTSCVPGCGGGRCLRAKLRAPATRGRGESLWGGTCGAALSKQPHHARTSPWRRTLCPEFSSVGEVAESRASSCDLPLWGSLGSIAAPKGRVLALQQALLPARYSQK